MLKSQTSLDLLRNEAEALENSGKVEEALAKLKQIRALKDSAFAAGEHGRVARDLKRWDEAEQAYFAATEMAAATASSHKAILYVQWAITLRHRHEEDRRQEYLERARTYLLKAIAIKELSFCHTVLGATYMRTAEFVLAEQHLRRALQLDPRDDEAMYNLAELEKVRAPEKAAELYKKSLAIDPDYAVAYRGLAEVYSYTERFEEAELLVRRSLQLDPNHWAAHTLLGELLQRKRRVRAARAELERGAELGKLQFHAQEALAWFYEHHGTLEQAAHAYCKCLELDPEDAWANRRYGAVLYYIGNASKAKMFLTRSLAIDPDNQLAKKFLDLAMKEYPHRRPRPRRLRKRRTGLG
jgi:tetratricopeptide (TPR) repeat protein